MTSKDMTSQLVDVKSSLQHSVFPSKVWKDFIVDGAHRDCAMVFHELFTSKWVYCEKAKQWYRLKSNNTYIKSETHQMNAQLDKVREILLNYYWLVAGIKDEQEAKKLNLEIKDNNKDYLNDIHKLINTLGNTTYRTSVVKLLTDLFSHENFSDLLDSKTHLFAFENKVVDLNNIIVLDNGELMYDERDIRITDYIETTCGYNFPDNLHDQKELAKKFIYELFPTDDDSLFALKTMAYMLHGDKSRCDYFFVWFGHGGNGKSTLTELLERVYGDYFSPIDISLFTGTGRENSSAATPQLANKKGKRIVITTEPERDDTLNLSKFKKLSDTQETRELYKSPIKFKAQYGVILLTNEYPTFTNGGKSLERRFRAQEFPYSFTENPVEPDEKPIDVNLKQKINTDEFRDGLMLLLLESFLKYFKVVDGKAVFQPLELSKNVREFTNECNKENDTIKRFVDTYLKKLTDDDIKKLVDNHEKRNPKWKRSTCEKEVHSSTSFAATEIYELYVEKMFGKKQKPKMEVSSFGKELKKRGFIKNNKGTKFINLQIDDNDDDNVVEVKSDAFAVEF